MKTRNAFTLVEILIVMVIIGLLAAMAIPAFQKVKQAAEIKKAEKVLSSKQVLIVSVPTGKVVITSPYRQILEQDGHHVKWIDTDGIMHEQALDQNLICHLTAK